MDVMSKATGTCKTTLRQALLSGFSAQLIAGCMAIAAPAWAQVQTWSSNPSAMNSRATPGSPVSLPTPPAPMIESLDTASRMGRVALVAGAAQLWDAQTQQWMPLMLNRPVTGGDRIRTDREARVEVQIGSLALLLGPVTDVEFPALDDRSVQARLVQGNLVARVQTVQWAQELLLSTAELQASAGGPGLYRLDRDTVSGGRSAAAALRGQLIVGSSAGRLDLMAGQRLEVLGPEAGGTTRRTTLLQDAFATWVATRDGLPDAALPAVVALPEITGLDQLDRHGRWESHPDIGWVWVPLTVSSNWEPFRDGRWVWVRPWGWTWIDDAPWGFAPSNYGRWVQWRSRWVWAPSSIRHRPHPGPGYAPPPPRELRPPRDDHRWGRDDDRRSHDDRWGRGNARDSRDDRSGRPDGDERRMRVPRVDGWGGTAAPSAAPAVPAAQAAPAAPAQQAPEAVPRTQPDRRHGFERREAAPPPRSGPERSDRGGSPERNSPAERQDRPDRGERQRQLAQ